MFARALPSPPSELIVLLLLAPTRRMASRGVRGDPHPPRPGLRPEETVQGLGAERMLYPEHLPESWFVTPTLDLGQVALAHARGLRQASLSHMRLESSMAHACTVLLKGLL